MYNICARIFLSLLSEYSVPAPAPYSLFLLLLLTIASITNDKHLPLTVASDSFHHAICYASSVRV